MKKTSSSTMLFVSATVIGLGLIVYAVWASIVPSPATAFAQCLRDEGVKMYGAWWCPHCQAQKKLFGNAFGKIEYVECSPGGTKTMSAQCKNDGIEGYPTWAFADGSRLSGEQSFAALSAKTGCEVPADPDAPATTVTTDNPDVEVEIEPVMDATETDATTP